MVILISIVFIISSRITITIFIAFIFPIIISSSSSFLVASDAGIGNITAELTNLGYYDGEVLLFFTTDNGGAPTLGSSNWPLRGGKSTVWEGGTRAVSFLHSQSLLPNAPYTWDGLIHAVDW